MNFIKIHNSLIPLKRPFATESEAYTSLLTANLSDLTSGSKALQDTSSGTITSTSLCEVLSSTDIGKRQGDDPSSSHALLLLLTDGACEFQAFEYSSWDTPIPVGSRVLLLPPYEVRRKVLLLAACNILVLTSTLI